MRFDPQWLYISKLREIHNFNYGKIIKWWIEQRIVFWRLLRAFTFWITRRMQELQTLSMRVEREVKVDLLVTWKVRKIREAVWWRIKKESLTLNKDQWTQREQNRYLAGLHKWWGRWFKQLQSVNRRCFLKWRSKAWTIRLSFYSSHLAME